MTIHTCLTCQRGARDERRGVYGQGSGWITRFGAPGYRVDCPDCDDDGQPRVSAASLA